MPTFHLAAIASHWYVGNSLRGDGLYLCISMIIYANLVSHVVEGSCHAQICTCFKCVQLLQVAPLFSAHQDLAESNPYHFSILFPIRQMEMAKDKFYSACTWNLLKSGMLPGPLVLMVQLTGTSFKRLTSRILPGLPGFETDKETSPATPSPGENTMRIMLSLQHTVATNGKT